MARPHRLTIRLNDAELRSVRKFADDKHVLPTVAVRWLFVEWFGLGKPWPATKKYDAAFTRLTNHAPSP
jgi:hypothetical protein